MTEYLVFITSYVNRSFWIGTDGQVIIVLCFIKNMNDTCNAIVHKIKTLKYAIALMLILHIASPWLEYSVPPMHPTVSCNYHILFSVVNICYLHLLGIYKLASLFCYPYPSRIHSDCVVPEVFPILWLQEWQCNLETDNESYNIAAVMS